MDTGYSFSLHHWRRHHVRVRGCSLCSLGILNMFSYFGRHVSMAWRPWTLVAVVAGSSSSLCSATSKGILVHGVKTMDPGCSCCSPGIVIVFGNFEGHFSPWPVCHGPWSLLQSWHRHHVRFCLWARPWPVCHGSWLQTLQSWKASSHASIACMCPTPARNR